MCEAEYRVARPANRQALLEYILAIMTSDNPRQPAKLLIDSVSQDSAPEQEISFILNQIDQTNRTIFGHKDNSGELIEIHYPNNDDQPPFMLINNLQG